MRGAVERLSPQLKIPCGPYGDESFLIFGVLRV